MELKLGKMTQAEISEWFGLKPDSFRKASEKSRRKKLEILSTYADFHIDKRTIFIDKIYIANYTPALQIVENNFDNTWNKNNIDTCARVNQELRYKNEELANQVKESTSYVYTLKVKTRKYGRNYIDEFGEEGYCEYVWCKFDEQTHTAEPLSKKEEAIMKECSKEAYGELSSQIALYSDALAKGEMTAKEFEMAVADLNTRKAQECYQEFIDLVVEKLGFFPDKATRIHKVNLFNN